MRAYQTTKNKFITYHKKIPTKTYYVARFDYVHSAPNFFLQINKAIEVAGNRPIGQKLLSRVGPVLSGDSGDPGIGFFNSELVGFLKEYKEDWVVLKQVF